MNNTFTHNTIEFDLALRGHRDSTVAPGHKATFNIIKDDFMSAGIRERDLPGFHFENNIGITFSDTTITNCGTSFDVFSGELGAVNLEASAQHSMQNLTFTNIDVVDAQSDGFSMGESGGFSGIQFTNCTLNGSGRDGTTTASSPRRISGRRSSPTVPAQLPSPTSSSPTLREERSSTPSGLRYYSTKQPYSRASAG